MLPNIWMIAAAAVYAIGAWEYIVATLKGIVKPNRVSWLLWGLAAGISLLAEVKQGVSWPALMTAMVTIGPLAVFAASFVNRKAYWRLTRVDIACGLFAVLGLLLWHLTKTANLAILFGILADFFASLPTVVKAYHAPHTEQDRVFLLSIVAAVITLMVIRTWSFASYAWPVYLVGLNTLFVVLIRFKIGIRPQTKTTRPPGTIDG
jgi:hypothetical protein